jgi:hypothetical protein
LIADRYMEFLCAAAKGEQKMIDHVDGDVPETARAMLIH